jgi:DNA-nicking Smr family endonuclease
MAIQSREVKQAHAVYDEARQMLGRQTVAQAHRQIKCLLVVHGFECSTHDDQSIMTDKKHQLLSDKLLVFFSLRRDLAVRTLGGYSLLILAK